MTRLKYLPFLMSIGIGLSVNNTRAVFEALFNKQSEFARTPKYRIEGDGDEWVGKKYRQSVAVQPLIELALGLYFTATVFYALANGIYGTVPFLVLFQVGFLYTGLLSIVQQYAGDPRSSPPDSQPGRPGVHEIQSRRSPRHARHHPLRHRSPGRSRRRLRRARARQDDDPQGQHLLALSRSRRPTPRRGSSKGTIQALARRGFTDQVCVQNKTVVTNAFKGEDLNHYVPIFKRYDIPVLYNFKDGDMKWVRYKPKARMRVLDRIFPKASTSPTTSSARTSSTCRRRSATSTRRRPAR